METISNVANTASKMIFGEGDTAQSTGEEPKSGETGKGTLTDPYDGGNKEENVADTSTSPTEKTASAPIDETAAKNAEQSTEHGQKQQGADRPNEEPTGVSTEAVKEKKDVAEQVQNKGPSSTADEGEKLMTKRDPNDHSGEPMKMHDGSENKSASTENKAEGGESKEEKGTGEQWVKTSGLAADGGDFDATKPGAGKEADRLLEQKGVHRDADGKQVDAAGETPAGAESADKPSKMERLKEKLHIGKHKD